MPIIQVDHLTKEYRLSAQNGLVDVSITIQQGEKAAVGWAK
jgi:hypothetical protein